MIRVAEGVVALLVLALALVAGAESASAAPRTFINGTQLLSTQGKAVHAHGGGMLKVGQYYYWVGQNTAVDNRFISVPLYRSTDLVSWEFRGDILTKSSAAELGTSYIERPKLLYNAATKKYVLWMHWENGDNYNEGRVAVATSSTIDGSYAYQGSFRPLGYESRDMTVFQDDDGVAYLFSSTADPSTNATTAIFRLDSTYTKPASLVGLRWYNQYREAPAVFKRNGVYFVVSSTTTGWSPNQLKYATASSITGTWSDLRDVGGPDGNRSQPAYVTTVTGSAGTSYLYLGDRWAGANGGPVNDSSYVWQPLRFPTSTSLDMPAADGVSIDTATGSVSAISAFPRSVIRSVASSLCVNVADDSTSAGSRVVQWTCQYKSNDTFARADLGSGNLQLMTQHSGLCLAQSGTAATGGPVVQTYCTGGTATQWRISGQTIVNRASGACLDVPDWSSTTGTALATYTCNGGANQKWTLG